MISDFSAVLFILFRHSARAWYSWGCGGYPILFGARDEPASKRIFVSEVSIDVHIDLTPKLSSASGMIFIFLSTFGYTSLG